MFLNVLKNLLYGLACAGNKWTVKLFLVGKYMKRNGEKEKKRKQTGFRVVRLFSQVGVELCVHTVLEIFHMHVVCKYLLSYDVLFSPTELLL